jgi:hypothetical protein
VAWGETGGKSTVGRRLRLKHMQNSFRMEETRSLLREKYGTKESIVT